MPPPSCYHDLTPTLRLSMRVAGFLAHSFSCRCWTTSGREASFFCLQEPITDKEKSVLIKHSLDNCIIHCLPTLPVQSDVAGLDLLLKEILKMFQSFPYKYRRIKAFLFVLSLSKNGLIFPLQDHN